mgnify:CR=1 FL=1
MRRAGAFVPQPQRAVPFLLEVSCDPARLGLTGYPTARRYAAVPLCQHLLGYLDSTGHGAAGLEKALDAVLPAQGEQQPCLRSDGAGDAAAPEKRLGFCKPTAGRWACS